MLAALEDWSRVCVAMEVLGVDRQEEEVFWLVIAAITDLGVMARYRYIYLFYKVWSSPGRWRRAAVRTATPPWWPRWRRYSASRGTSC